MKSWSWKGGGGPTNGWSLAEGPLFGTASQEWGKVIYQNLGVGGVGAFNTDQWSWNEGRLTSNGICQSWFANVGLGGETLPRTEGIFRPFRHFHPIATSTAIPISTFLTKIHTRRS